MKLLPVVLLFWAAPALFASTAFDDAKALYKEKKYPEAQAAFEKIAAAEPNNAAAAYYLGMTLRSHSDTESFERGLKSLHRAVELEPDNAGYLADFGGTSMQFADRIQKSSKLKALSAAREGRDAMEKSLKLNPENLDAREGLYQFYDQAPWPLGSSSKAAEQLEEIRKRDPLRASMLTYYAKMAAKDYGAAFKICDDYLAQKPDNYLASFFYGRTAAISGQNLEKGIATLKQCLALPRPKGAPTYMAVWNRIGNIYEQLKRPSDARAAYEESLKLDPNNKDAKAALEKLKP
jgi:tetratricopeptide (TPR) repeat protein